MVRVAREYDEIELRIEPAPGDAYAVRAKAGDDAAEAPFTPLDETAATTEALFGELDAADWSRRCFAAAPIRRTAPLFPSRSGS
jgi:hypothetical protein